MIIAPWIAAGASADLLVDADFDTGSIGPYTINELLGEIEFTLTPDGVNYTYWANFKVSGVSANRRNPTNLEGRYRLWDRRSERPKS